MFSITLHNKHICLAEATKSVSNFYSELNNKNATEKTDTKPTTQPKDNGIIPVYHS